MEKLIELLNEYKPLNKGVHYEYNNGLFIMYDGSGREIGTSIEDEILISKKYGFVKWLVENDKIDFDKCGLDVRHYLSYNERYDKGIVMAENYDNDTLVREFYSPYKQLLMLLSISDTPIEDLISYLK